MAANLALNPAQATLDPAAQAEFNPTQHEIDPSSIES